MIKLKKSLGVILSLCIMFCACGCENGGEKGTNITPNSKNLTGDVESQRVSGRNMDEEFVSATADFSVELFRTSTASNLEEGKNVLVSPESVICALSMTANGAAGDNKEEMEQTLISGMDISKYNEYMYTYNSKLTDSEEVVFNMANSIWVKDNEAEIRVKEDFLQICGSYYGADVFMAPFDNSTVEDINSWVNKNTNQMIPELLDEMPDGVVMYLINALAFEGVWEIPYEEHQVNEDGKFTNYAGVEQTVNMLTSAENIYLEDEGAVGFIKNYQGGDFAFMAILPKDEDGLMEYVEGMSGDGFINLYETRQYKDVIVKLPEFSYEYDIELSDSLKEMGMEIAFGRGADFSNMAETSSGNLYINRVLHKTFIQVDREGTKAATVTAVEMTTECAVETEPPKEVILDRPFIYAIVDTETGLPIFMGVVNSIE